MHLGLLAFVKAHSNQRSEAREIVAELAGTSTSRYISPLDIANAQLGLRECDTAISFIKRAMSERVMRVTELPMFLFDEVQEDPTVLEFCQQLGARC